MIRIMTAQILKILDILVRNPLDRKCRILISSLPTQQVIDEVARSKSMGSLEQVLVEILGSSSRMGTANRSNLYNRNQISELEHSPKLLFLRWRANLLCQMDINKDTRMIDMLRKMINIMGSNRVINKDMEGIKSRQHKTGFNHLPEAHLQHQKAMFRQVSQVDPRAVSLVSRADLLLNKVAWHRSRAPTHFLLTHHLFVLV
jgi:hypothetical protein